MKDIQEKINKSLGRQDLKLKTKLECLIELHNEVMRDYAIFSTDKDFFEYKILEDPGNKDWYHKKTGAETNIKDKKAILDSLEAQINEELKK